jgi:integrase
MVSAFESGHPNADGPAAEGFTVSSPVNLHGAYSLRPKVGCGAKAQREIPMKFKRNTGDFGTVSLAEETFYLLVRSFIDVKTGRVLSTRKQQRIKLGRKDTSLWKSVSSTAVILKASEHRQQIEKWEAIAANNNDEVAPSGDMLVSEFYTTKFLPALRTRVETKQVAAATLTTICSYWDTFLAGHFNGTKTLANYQSWMGRQFLDTLRKKDGSPYGENTVNKIHSTASGIFTDAVERGYCDHNPWRDIKRTKAPSVSAEQGVAYTEAQVVTMIRNLDSDLGGRKDVNVKAAQVALGLGFWAGLRPSEIIALKWENVDTNAGKITVCESIVYGVHAERTKTDVDRVVPYLSPLVPMLRAWKAACGNPTSGFVLQGRDGGVINMNSLSDRIIYPNCERNGLGDLWKGNCFYACRRGCGTLLAEHGATAEEGSKFLGNTIAVFEANYLVDRGTLGARAADKYEQNKRRELEQGEERESGKELLALGAGQ